ncbi:MAG: DNA polymerase I [Nitrospirae bacterium]|nr:DNA polymerase I [Candidatus Manganitrophaceae bacterium]
MASQFYIIDGSSYIYRAFYAIRELSNSSGLPTNATYGFTKMLLKIIHEKKPDYLGIAFDAKGPTFRSEIYAEYKANRPPMPDLMRPQIPYIHKMVKALKIPFLEKSGLEADDLIGTLANLGEAAGLQVVIVTGDKDMNQLITPNITVYDSMKDRVLTEAGIQEKFGIAANQIVDMMGLMGDTSDNIPGLPGVGQKTAIKLIQEFGSIKNLLQHTADVKRPKLRETLESQKELALLSRALVLIKTDCDLDFVLEDYKVQAPDAKLLLPLCQELEFPGLIKDLLPKEKAPELRFEIVDEKALAPVILQIKTEGSVAIRLLSSDLNAMYAKVLGIALVTASGKRVYFPFPKDQGLPQDLLDLLAAAEVLFYGHDLKPFLTILNRQGIVFGAQIFDIKIAAYLINPVKRDYSLEALMLEYLKEHLEAETPTLFSKNDHSAEVSAPVLCREADAILRLSKLLENKLESRSLKKLFEEMEILLVPVLSEIEQNGVKIDSDLLNKMSDELSIKLATVTEKIYALAGSAFNINSPKQLSEILFNRLGLNPIKKTKTGYSTNEDVLTQLAIHHPLPEEILNSRQIVKLKSTYVDALPKLVHPETGRIHTQLNQAVAATGRLSSTEPNLQNIPIKGDMGRRIREAFIAEPGNVILSADYNQIELRLLAHLSGDPELLAAFQNNEDVHTRTAMELFQLHKDEVTPDMRRAAKSVNFGIIYGISPFGLAKNIGVSLPEAKGYIDRYFEHYAGVRDFLDETLKTATEKGYVTTLFDRRRDIPELASHNHFTRGVGERLATNTPLQGSAADIIKIAMIHVSDWMSEEKVKSLMTLQVHDELLFDVPEDEVPLMHKKIKALMEGAAQLKVPLTVDVGIGLNWAEAH